METAKMLYYQQMDQENVVFIHNGIFAAMKKNEMLSFAGKWMELENIILIEVSLAQKTKILMFSLICRYFPHPLQHLLLVSGVANDGYSNRGEVES
jgi:hypothetical protein